MTTPAFQTQSLAAQVSSNGATGATVQCNTVAGAAVNISSGFVAKVLVQSNANANPLTAPVDVTASCAFAYGATGLLAITFLTALAALLPGQANNATVLLSNDAGTTESAVAIGSISINRSDVTT
jgi:hypothetical protein